MTTIAPAPERFDAVAAGYDRLADACPGYHRNLRLSVQRMGLPGDGAGLRLLDVGCGTGASTAALLEVLPRASVVGVDVSARMLERARAKRWPATVRFVRGRVEHLGGAGVRGRFDGALAAFLLADLADAGDSDAALRALYAMLRPGAPLAVHDRTVAGSIRARLRWDAVCWGLVIPAGSLVTGGSAFYRDQWRATRRFDTVGDFEARLGRAGFADLRTQTMPGWERAVMHTWLARRPLSDAG